MTIRPLSKLETGAHIRIVGPASAVHQDKIEAARRALESRGYEVSYGEHLFERWTSHLALAGEDRDRAADVMQALTDPAVDMVLMGRGGYGTMRLLPYLDARALECVEPKPVVGFSDITALHSYLAQVGWPTIHGPNAHSNLMGETLDSLCDLLEGRTREISSDPLEPLNEFVREPVVAPWHGGNLAIIASLVGTPYQPLWDGAVLYFEEVHEAPYRIDRMMNQLLLSGLLHPVRGLVFGEVVFDTGPDADAVKAIVCEVAGRIGIPAWWGIQSGHSEPMFSLPLGLPLEISAQGRVRMGDGVQG